MNSPAGQPLSGIWASSRDNLYAVGANGKVLHYDGSVWIELFASEQDRPPIHFNAICGAAADEIFAVGQAERPGEAPV